MYQIPWIAQRLPKTGVLHGFPCCFDNESNGNNSNHHHHYHHHVFTLVVVMKIMVMITIIIMTMVKHDDYENDLDKDKDNHSDNVNDAENDNDNDTDTDNYDDNDIDNDNENSNDNNKKNDNTVTYYNIFIMIRKITTATTTAVRAITRRITILCRAFNWNLVELTSSRQAPVRPPEVGQGRAGAGVEGPGLFVQGRVGGIFNKTSMQRIGALWCI